MTTNYLTPTKSQEIKPNKKNKIFRQDFPSIILGTFDSVFPLAFRRTLNNLTELLSLKIAHIPKKYVYECIVGANVILFLHLIRLGRDRKPSLKSVLHARLFFSKNGNSKQTKTSKSGKFNHPLEIVAKTYRYLNIGSKPDKIETCVFPSGMFFFFLFAEMSTNSNSYISLLKSLRLQTFHEHRSTHTPAVSFTDLLTS